MLNDEDLKTRPKELLAATSLKREEFEALLVAFGQAYGRQNVQLKDNSASVRQVQAAKASYRAWKTNCC